MIIFWGTKRIERKQGYVADFCPMCRGIRQFSISKISMATHFQGISLGSGRLAGYEIKCTECGSRLERDPTVYKQIQKSRQDSRLIESLINATFPNIREVFKQRLEVEEKFQQHPEKFDAATRLVLIREPFVLVSPEVEGHFSRTNIDLHVAVAAALTIVVPIMVGYAPGFAKLDDDTQTGIILATIGTGVVGIFVQGFKSSGRYMRRSIYPKIANALQPLKPTPKELEAVLAEFRKNGAKIGRKSKLNDLLAAFGSQSNSPTLS